MSMPNDHAEDTTPKDDGPSPDEETTESAAYGSLSIEDDPKGTVDPGELAGGALEDDEDVS